MQTKAQPEVLYRYEDLHYADHLHVQVILREFLITKITPRGAWVDNYGTPRFVLSGAYKRFACPTKKEAIESFIARKKRQVRILTAQCEIAQKSLLVAERMSVHL